MLVERKEYLEQLKAWKDEQVIKVVTGIRRCGKGKEGLTAKSNSVRQHHITRSRNLSVSRPSGRLFAAVLML